MQKIPVSLHIKNKSPHEAEKVLKNNNDSQKNTPYKKISDNIQENQTLKSDKTHNSQQQSKLTKVVSKEIRLLEQKLEKLLLNNTLSKNIIDDKLLTNKIYQDITKIDNPQQAILHLHTQVLLQPWNYNVVDREIYFRILSILNSKDKNLSSEELLNSNENKNKDQKSIHNHKEKDFNENSKNKKNNNLKPKDKDSPDNLEGLAFIQWLSAIADENTNELNDFLNRMRIFQPLEFFQRIQNISTNINLFVDNHGHIKVTNFHKDKKIIEQSLNERGRLRSHIWSMVGFDHNTQGHLA